MKYCAKCGQAIPEGAKFCSYCGEVTESAKASQQGTTYYQSPAPVETSKTYTREEEQKHLDSLSNRLKWERIAWKVSGIILLVCSIVLLSVSTIFGIVGIVGLATAADNPQVNVEDYNFDDYGYHFEEYGGSDDYYYNEFDSSADVGVAVAGGVGAFMWGLYFGMGLTFLPIGIVNLVMAKKVGKYRDKIYTDCTDAVKHATSVGSIVLGALFNEYALIAIIINFILTKKNKEVFDRIQANQSAYNNTQA